MREGFFERSIPAIMDEIRWLYSHFQITHFQFADELLMSSVNRTEDICLAISQLPFKIKWDCNGRLNYAKSPLLRLMKTSGAQYVNYGIESLNQTVLNQMGKGLTLDQIHSGVEETLKAGLSPGLNLLWGFPGEGVGDLKEAVRFLKEFDPAHELRTIRPVTPYPGTPLYKKAIEMGLIQGPEDFYERKHKNSDLFTVNFMDMPIEDAHKHLYDANLELMDDFLSKRGLKNKKMAYKLYYEGDKNFRGFRTV